MGIDSVSLSFEHFDILMELERARPSLDNRAEDKEVSETEMADYLPLEEIKLIACQSEESDDDGFKLVLSKRKKNSAKKKSMPAKVPVPQPVVGDDSHERGVSKTCSWYNLRKNRVAKKLSD